MLTLRRAAGVLLLCLSLAGIARAQDNKNMDTKPITILSYNIRHGTGMDGKLDLQRTADAINRQAPDLVGLQEVDLNAKRSGLVDEATTLGSLTGMKPFFGKAIPFQGGEYGIAILARDPDATMHSHIPLPGAEPRTLLAIQTKTKEGKPFVFVNTHFDLQQQHQIESAKIIAGWMEKLDGLPAILVGDFNCTPNSETFLELTKSWKYVTKGKPLPTFPAPKPSREIDHAFIAPAHSWELEDIQVVQEPLASDHRPLKIEIHLK
ncbi:MAG: endonuclease [Lentisphaerae bacterium]|jgi:endonuclease/exonuclease/phosphatase family metal-dependent hydrolase|nr:endonuclease [Lentisphaerota bacterium]